MLLFLSTSFMTKKMHWMSLAYLIKAMNTLWIHSGWIFYVKSPNLNVWFCNYFIVFRNPHCANKTKGCTMLNVLFLFCLGLLFIGIKHVHINLPVLLLKVLLNPAEVLGVLFHSEVFVRGHRAVCDVLSRICIASNYNRNALLLVSNYRLQDLQS